MSCDHGCPKWCPCPRPMNTDVITFRVSRRPREMYCGHASVCLSVCPRGYHQNHTSDLYQIFCACCRCPWLGPPPAGWRNPKGKGQFCRVFFPIDNALQRLVTLQKGIIKSPVMSWSIRDHSVAAAIAANGIGREGGDGSAQCRQNMIYDCLVLMSFLCCFVFWFIGAYLLY